MKLRSRIAWGIRDFLGLFIALNRNARVVLWGQLPDYLNDSRTRRHAEGSIRRCGRSNRAVGQNAAVRDVIDVVRVGIVEPAGEARSNLLLQRDREAPVIGVAVAIRYALPHELRHVADSVSVAPGN